MSSPFRYFRKHTKAFMAVAAVMCMFLFVFASGSGGGGGGSRENPLASATVATWNGGRITEGELASLVQQRLITDQFLQMVFVQAGGQYNYDLPQSVPRLFLNSRDTDQVDIASIETELFASLATKAGMTVSDDMINRYIQEVGLRRVGNDDIRGIMANLGDGNARANEAIVFSTLRKLLLAYFYSQSYDDASLLVLPEQRWEDWKRVNERISLQVAMLPAESFLDEVPEPTEAQLKALFEEHKEQTPDRYVVVGGQELPVAEPGFAEPRRVKLQYLVGSVAERTEALMSAVTDEEIADYYERNKRLEFVKEDDPLGDLDFGNDVPFDPLSEEGVESPADEETTDEAEMPEAGAPATDETDAEALGDAVEEPAAPTEETTPTDETAPSAETADAAAPEAQDPPAETESTEAEATETEPAETESAEPAESGAPESTSSGEDEPAAAPADGEQSSTTRRSPFRLVALQADASEERDAAEGDAPAGEVDDATAPQAPAERDDAAETAATDSSGEAAPVAEGSPPAETADVGEAPAGAEAAVEEELEYVPLDDVREDIRRAIAREKAVDELKRIVSEAAARLRSQYNQYARRLIEARDLERKTPEPPARLKDLAWLAQETGLKLETTDPLTTRELYETPLGKAADEQSGRITVTQAAFLSLELYEPYLAKEIEGDRYLAIKVADSPLRVPSFDEVHDQVAAAWKKIEAAKIAEKKAGELAESSSTATGSFEEFAKAQGYEVIPQTTLFSWRSFPFGPGIGAPPQLSTVPELKNIGPQFMEAAFSLDGNAAKAVMNHDRSAAYVIRLHSRQYTPDELRKLFLAEINTWLGERDMVREHQIGFNQLTQSRLMNEFAGFKFDEEWQQRREQRLAERN